MSAYTILCGPDTPRDEWLALRRSGVGASDIAAILGLSPYSTPWQTWLDKTGQLPDRPPTDAMDWGNRLEPLVLAWFAEQNVCKVSRTPGLCRSNDRPWQLATPDALAEDDDGPACVQAKTTRYGDGFEGDSIPIGVVLQTHQEMDVLGVDRAYVPVLIGGNEPRWYVVDRDPAITEQIRPAGAQFWQQVQDRVEPTAVAADLSVLSSYYKPIDDAQKLVADTALIKDIERRPGLCAARDALDEQVKDIDARIKQALGARTHAVDNGLIVATWKPRKDGVRVLNIPKPESRKAAA